MMMVLVFVLSCLSEICETQGSKKTYYHSCNSDEYVCAVPNKLMKHVCLICR